MKAPVSAAPKDPKAQYATLPWRKTAGLQIMLVTSRETRRWVVPKGWPIKGLTPHESAAQEALEEAGIVGKVSAEAIGDFHYIKRAKNGSFKNCRVTVFPLEVAFERASWIEEDERVRKWFGVKEAADAVHEPELKALIHAFGKRMSGA